MVGETPCGFRKVLFCRGRVCFGLSRDFTCYSKGVTGLPRGALGVLLLCGRCSFCCTGFSDEGCCSLVSFSVSNSKRGRRYGLGFKPASNLFAFDFVMARQSGDARFCGAFVVSRSTLFFGVVSKGLGVRTVAESSLGNSVGDDLFSISIGSNGVILAGGNRRTSC